jgi:hypothetical protein
VLTIAAAGLDWIDQDRGRYWLGGSALLGIAVLAVFPIYFQRVNMSFRTGPSPLTVSRTNSSGGLVGTGAGQYWRSPLLAPLFLA